MPPKSTSRPTASKSATKETKGRATRGGGAHTVRYAEEDDEIDDGEGYGGAGEARRGGDDEEDEDEDPVSTAELQKVIKAFSKGKASKEKANAAKVASQCEKLLASTETSAKANIKQQLAKCDQFVLGLHLDDESISLGGHDSAHYAALLEKQKNEAEDQLTIFDEIIEEMDPAKNLFYEEVRQHLADRPALGKRCHKKLRNAMQKELAEQAEMAELYAQAAPKIAKGFKIAMGA
ncbi:hypothetical protein BCR35DRAFT_335174 [Leucosporidium creatinivorum]|uniref:Uncharacterized protein n=1 Tax=Leucosporidium creatinivorum TaxID=106004 RepID=A0A1Y2DHG8_9BASI|nr:hypothetical protein BCR35DRAFT_335174 [Leucosporidium creatinivorum]